MRVSAEQRTKIRPTDKTLHFSFIWFIIIFSAPFYSVFFDNLPL